VLWGCLPCQQAALAGIEGAMRPARLSCRCSPVYGACFENAKVGGQVFLGVLPRSTAPTVRALGRGWPW
jgi:hypothetical protein